LKIHIVGGGAIGLLHAGKLAQSGQEVIVWTRTETQAALLQKEGIELEALDGSVRKAAVNSHSLSNLEALLAEDPVEPAWILLTVKQSHIDELLVGQLKKLSGPQTAMLCLQNGIGHLDKLSHALPDLALYAGVTSEGARRIEENGVRHTGKGQLWFGPANWDKKDENLQNLLLNVLQSAGFSVGLSNQMRDQIYQKLLINAVINALTAIFDITNGELPRHPSRIKLMHSLYQETSTILTADGMILAGDGWQLVLDVCEATSANVSSMLSDVRSRRETEIDWINGGVSAVAKRYGIPSPLNDAVTALVKQFQ
jgi:2-dehydropantoate 2-reductase